MTSARAAPVPKPAPPQKSARVAPQAATPTSSSERRPQDRAAPGGDAAHKLLGGADPGSPIQNKPAAGYSDVVAMAGTPRSASASKPAATTTAAHPDKAGSPPKRGTVPRPSHVIELQGAAQLAPGAWGDYIKSFGGDPVEVDVKWGTLAPKTSIQLQWDSALGFVTPGGSYQPLAIVQPFFEHLPAPLAPALFIHIRGGMIDGFAAPHVLKHVTSAHRAALVTALGNTKNLAALGLVGFKLPNPKLTNEIQNGHFVFGGDALTFKIAEWVTGSLMLRLTDDTVAFAASADGTIVGLGAFHLNVIRKDGHYEGSVDVPLKLGKASGNVLVSYINGDVSATGTITYVSEKFNGSLTVMSGDANEVQKTARGQLDPAKLLADEKVADDQTADKAKKGQRGIGAWGQLNFTFTDWLTGTAVTILDPFGHLTIVGKIAVAKEVVLMKAPPPVKHSIPPFPLGVTARYGLPHIADVHIGFDLDVGYTAWVGPAVLTNIELGGTYSTDPKILQDFYIGGSFRISAYAGLYLSVSVKAGVTILGHDLDAVGTITGSAGLKAYAAADAKIGYREKADPIAGKKGEAYLQGHLEAAAQPVLGLGGEVAIKLTTPWWSPLSDRTWPIELFRYEWPLDASLGVGADIDYIIGSNKFPDVTFGKVDFDASKFSDAVIDDNVPAKKGAAASEKPGTWKGVAPKIPTAPITPPPKKPAPAGGRPARAGTPSTKAGRGKQTPAEAKSGPKTQNASQSLMHGFQALSALHDRAEAHPATSKEVHADLAKIKSAYGFSHLTPTLSGDYWSIDAEPSPKSTKKKPTVKAAKDKDHDSKGKGNDGKADDKKPDGTDTRTPEEKQRDLDAAIAAALEIARQRGTTRATVDAALPGIAQRYGLRALRTVNHGEGSYRIHGEVNPAKDSSDLPDIMTVERAIAEVKRNLQMGNEHIEISVSTVADAEAVIHGAFPDGARKFPSPTPGGAYGSQPDMKSMREFRGFRKVALAYHVDVQRYRVSEISTYLEQEIVQTDALIERSQSQLQSLSDNSRSARKHPGVRENLIAQLAGAQQRSMNLQEIRRQLASHLPEWQKLEQEGVLYGHQTVDAVESHHRTNPHVNVEGPVSIQTRTESLDLHVKLAIYVHKV